MKKMLLVGGVGYIGGCVTDLFSGLPDYEITVYDNLLYESRYLKEVNFIYGDIRDEAKLGAIINDYDAVVWLAALVGDGACAIDAETTEKINFSAVKWLTDNYKGLIIFMSTCSVYGINNMLIDETAATNPISLYAATKLMAEQYLVDNAKDYLIFRLGTLYGISDSFSRPRLDLVVNVLTLKAVVGEKLTVFGGKQWRPILHVKDVAYAILYCIENNVRGLYNLSERNVEISELAQEIAQIIPSTKIIYKETKFEDLRDYKVLNTKIKTAGWLPKYSLTPAVEEMAQLFKERRVKDVRDPVYYNVEHLKQNGGKI